MGSLASLPAVTALFAIFAVVTFRSVIWVSFNSCNSHLKFSPSKRGLYITLLFTLICGFLHIVVELDVGGDIN